MLLINRNMVLDNEELVREVHKIIDRPDWSVGKIKHLRNVVMEHRLSNRSWAERYDRAFRQLPIAWRLHQLSLGARGKRSFIHPLARRVVSHLIIELRDLTAET